MTDYRFEAWRNFLLILAGLLVAEAVTRAGDLRAAVRSLSTYDKTLDLGAASGLVAFLIIVFVFKNAHGVLVTLYRSDYVSAVSGSKLATALSCALTTAVVMSMGLVLRLNERIMAQDRLQAKATWLMLTSLVPVLFFVLFDLFYLIVFAQEGQVSLRDLTTKMLRQAVHQLVAVSPFDREEMQAHRMVWLVLDVLSIVLFVTWWTIVNVATSHRVVIHTTLVVLCVQLVLHSLLDYVLNFSYFFYWRRPQHVD